MIDLRAVGLESLAALVRDKQLAARELVGHALAMIERHESLNAWVVVGGDAALRAADAVDRAIASGTEVPPLAGIPIGVKDMEDAARFRTAYGSLLHRDDPPAIEDSVQTARLRAAGCIVVGKTTTPEHGWAGDTVSPLTGATLNPYDPTRSPGGSSGGTAVALATGMVPLATGSDGGGSIRGPASICGLTALKPSARLVPLGGPRHPGAGILAVRAPMAVRAADVAYAMSLVVGPDPGDPFSLPVQQLDWSVPRHPPLPPRVAWARAPGFPVDGGVAAACDLAMRTLEQAGTEVIAVDLHERPPLGDWWTIWTAYRNRAQGHHRGTPAWDLIDPGLRAEMDHAHERVDAVRLLKAFDRIHEYNREIEAALSLAPFLLTPTVASETARSGHRGTVDGEETPYWSPFTQVFNLTRHPAGSVPCGTTAAGLPVGMQVVGPHHRDPDVLRVLAALEALWRDLVPAFPEEPTAASS